MAADNIADIFNEDMLTELFPPERADQFFDALFGDPAEGAYDIRLQFKKYAAASNTLHFELHLCQRPGKCLACNLTYGLPDVFSRHPVINIAGLVQEIDKRIADCACGEWKLGSTQSVSNSLHIIPLRITLS